LTSEDKEIDRVFSQKGFVNMKLIEFSWELTAQGNSLKESVGVDGDGFSN
jgi:hypothetical protein